MKKLLLLSLSFFLTIGVYSQSLEFLNVEDQVLVAPGDEGSAEITSYMDVQNISDEAITVIVRREALVSVAGTDNRFCWGGVCYDNDTDESILEEEITPGEIIVSQGFDGFSGYYNYNGNEGLTTIRYCFVEVGNESNQTCVDIDYCVSDDCESLVSVENPDAQPFEISSISPNPVRGLSSIQYNFNVPGQASLVVYNMVGAEVKSVDLDNRQGVVLLNADEFENGVYLYSLVYNGDVVQTKRMVVSK